MSAYSREFMPTTIPLTEPERRRVEFAGGTAVVLPDGVPWRFYELTPFECTARDGDGTGESRMIAWDFGSDLDAETNASLGQGFQRLLAKIDRAANANDRACGMLEAAWFLLARNYIVSQDDFENLLLMGATHRSGQRRRLYAALRGVVVAPINRMAVWATARNTAIATIATMEAAPWQ